MINADTQMSGGIPQTCSFSSSYVQPNHLQSLINFVEGIPQMAGRTQVSPNAGDNNVSFSLFLLK